MAFFCLQSFRVPCAFPARCGVEKPDTFRRCSNTCGCARRRAGDVSGGATTFTSSTLLSLAATPPFCPRGRKVGDVGGRNKRYRESRRYDIWFSLAPRRSSAPARRRARPRRASLPRVSLPQGSPRRAPASVPRVAPVLVPRADLALARPAVPLPLLSLAPLLVPVLMLVLDLARVRDSAPVPALARPVAPHRARQATPVEAPVRGLEVPRPRPRALGPTLGLALGLSLVLDSAPRAAPAALARKHQRRTHSARQLPRPLRRKARGRCSSRRESPLSSP